MTSIAFLGPDGSGKTTIINSIFNEYANKKVRYFHLKPEESKSKQVNSNPHSKKEYSFFLSICKLLYFLFQYNFLWIKNIRLKRKQDLIIFDRYFDDLIIDKKRYRYGASDYFAKVVLKLIPQPDYYFVLTSTPEVIYSRKKEIEFQELKRLISKYNSFCDEKKYIKIDVSESPNEITKKILLFLK